MDGVPAAATASLVIICHDATIARLRLSPPVKPSGSGHAAVEPYPEVDGEGPDRRNPAQYADGLNHWI